MFNVDRMSDFIASMPGDSAEVTKTVLQSMEREIREGRAAKAMLAANAGIGDAIAAIASTGAQRGGVA